VPADALAGDEIGHAVDHHERIAMRENFENLADLDLDR
jgi:hypothetical protein